MYKTINYNKTIKWLSIKKKMKTNSELLTTLSSCFIEKVCKYQDLDPQLIFSRISKCDLNKSH